MSKWRKTFTLFVLPLFCSLPVNAQEAAMQDFVPLTDEAIQNPADEDWLSWRRTLDAWGYSPLDQINRDNVGDLRLAWARAMMPGSNEATPLVYDGVMFLPNPGAVIQALDAATGDLIWEYAREMPADLADFNSLTDITRTLAIHGNMIIFAASDGFLVALDATSGTVVWETQVFDYKTQNARHSGGPIIANGKIITPRACSARGGPGACFVTAHDVQNGEELWRFYTVPRDGDPGFETWGDAPYESRRHVGTWMVPSYDPELNLVYVGTSVTAPYSKFYLNDPSLDLDYLYQTSTLALDGDTGELRWYFQHIRDQWDLDHPFERLLVDTVVAPDPAEVRWINPALTPGEERAVMTGIPGKTGIVYTIDRATGEFLWARETVYQNVVADMDLTTGRADHPAEMVFTAVGQDIFVCPHAGGGKDWQAGTYSPRTNTMYYPLQNTCMTATTFADSPTPQQGGALRFAPEIAEGTENLGSVWAINAETGATSWTFETRAAAWSLVSTGGGLVFGGDLNRRFRALDDETGEVLWETILGGPAAGYPISYGSDGRQFVAFPVGTTGVIGGGLLNLTPELQPGTGGNYLFVFALPDA